MERCFILFATRASWPGFRRRQKSRNCRRRPGGNPAGSVFDDAARLAAVDDGHNLSLWDMEHWTFSRNIAVPAQVPTQCDLPERALCLSSRLPMACRGPGRRHDCDVGLPNGSPVVSLLAKTAGCVTFSCDGSHLAVGGTENPLGVWQCDAGMKSIVLAQDVSYSATALSSKGERLAGSEDGMLAIWDVKTRKQLHAARFKDRVATSCIRRTTRYRSSATPDDSSIDLWDAGTGKPVGRLDGHRAGHVAAVQSRWKKAPFQQRRHDDPGMGLGIDPGMVPKAPSLP